MGKIYSQCTYMMEQNKRKTGGSYEKAVGFYLEQSGYEILQYNYRCRLGEIDLIAKDGEYLVFCEVKYRRKGGLSRSLEAVGSKKQITIARCAKWYLMEQRLRDVPCRFDVVGIDGQKIYLIKDAFRLL